MMPLPLLAQHSHDPRNPEGHGAHLPEIVMWKSACLLLPFLATMATAQSFTTAAEVKPILSATKPYWIAVREFDGQDLLYFTNLLAWRCGVENVFYAVNDGGVPVLLKMEPCHDDTAQPNALMIDDILPYVIAPPGSIQTVTVGVVYDDGTQDFGQYERKAVLTP